MRAVGRPSGSTVASVIACAFRLSANASFSQLSRSGSGSAGSSVGRGGLVTLFLQKGERAGHVRGTDRRRRVEIGRPDGRETIDAEEREADPDLDRKSTRLNSSHGYISYAVFCLKKKKIVVLEWDNSFGQQPHG